MQNYKEKIIKGLIAAGFSAAVAVGGFYLTAQSEAPNGVPILSTYLDTGGVPTVCLGSTKDEYGRKLKMGVTLTEDQCVALFIRDYTTHCNSVNKAFKGEWKSGWQQAAMCDFAFNKGVGAFQTSTLLKRLNEGKHDTACDELMRWVYGRNSKGQKVVINGLVNRATKEYKWCMGEVPYEVQQIALSYSNALSEK